MKDIIIYLFCAWIGALLGSVSGEEGDYTPVFFFIGVPSLIVVIVLIGQALVQ